MVRSLSSGVAGMKAHQTRLDVIANNISNVNTYGFKSSRVTFRDVYYQSMRSASAGTGTKGGTNPSQVGYGSSIGSIDVMQTQSMMANTGNPLDLGIAGDGFLQVQDAAGNIFYTKAGMLDIDSQGNLVDLNGNFVLGTSGNPVGQAPGSNHIKFNIPSVAPKGSSATELIQDIKYTITGSKETTDGNIVFNFLSAMDMPIGEKAEAIVTSSGVNVRLNAKEIFSNIGELNTVVNEAIKKANGGKEHPGGTFTITMDPATKFNNLTGAEIAGKEFGVKSGKVPLPADLVGQFTIDAVGENFKGTLPPKYTFTQETAKTATADAVYKMVVEVDTDKYEATLTSSQMKSPGSVKLKKTSGAADDKDYITLGYPSENSLVGGAKTTQKPKWKLNDIDPDTGKAVIAGKIGQVRQYIDADLLAKLIPEGYKVGDFGPLVGADGKIQFEGPWTATEPATPSTPSKDLGLASKPFNLTGGTKGGSQTVNDLSGISIGSDGIIRAMHAAFEDPLEIGRIDLATFANPKALEQSGSTYFVSSANSGDAKLAQAGLDGSGKLASGALEMSNVDLSQEFSDMITTQRGFQANSRIITVSDTMLEELINLKR